MRVFFSLILLTLMSALILYVPFKGAMAADKVKVDSTDVELTMITLYDNYQHNPDLKTGWGFSCLVRAGGKNILFDTGADSPTLLGNMNELNIDPKEIDIIVLSHIHGDHTGGLYGILKENSDITIYLPISFPQDFKKDAESYQTEVVEVDDSATIHENVITTGELGTSTKEQSLIVKTGKGLVVITGCAHPGIVEILKEAKKITGEDIYLVLGGFHLAGASDSELKKIIESFRELGVKKAAPCHCSGDRTRELFKEEYKEDYISNGVGKIIEI